MDHRASGVGLPAAMLFDMDDTVVDTYRASRDAWREAAARLAGERGWDREQAGAALFAADRWYWTDQERADWGRLNQAGARVRIARRALQQLAWRDEGISRWVGPFVVQARVRALQPFAGALETLAELRRRGVALALVTNGEAASQRAKIEQVQLAERFDLVVVEGEFGIGKPEPEVFEHALAGIGTSPEKAWMVGDDLAKDIAGGQGLGLRTVWVDSRAEGLPANAPARPDRIVQAIAELIPRG
jgi:putative hydrolase of the HAD superfamily